MSKKQPPRQNKKPSASKLQPQESVFKEAWGNMNEDMARIMPAFLTKSLQKGKGKLWVVVLVTFVELVVLGVVGKFIYDWFTGP